MFPGGQTARRKSQRCHFTSLRNRRRVRSSLALERLEVRNLLAADVVIDMPATGVPNGTNMQSGFLDIADTPYPEIIEASRGVAARLYTERLGQR